MRLLADSTNEDAMSVTNEVRSQGEGIGGRHTRQRGIKSQQACDSDCQRRRKEKGPIPTITVTTDRNAKDPKAEILGCDSRDGWPKKGNALGPRRCRYTCDLEVIRRYQVKVLPMDRR